MTHAEGKVADDRPTWGEIKVSFDQGVLLMIMMIMMIVLTVQNHRNFRHGHGRTGPSTSLGRPYAKCDESLAKNRYAELGGHHPKIHWTNWAKHEPGETLRKM